MSNRIIHQAMTLEVRPAGRGYDCEILFGGVRAAVGHAGSEQRAQAAALRELAKRVERGEVFL